MELRSKLSEFRSQHARCQVVFTHSHRLDEMDEKNTDEMRMKNYLLKEMANCCPLHVAVDLGRDSAETKARVNQIVSTALTLAEDEAQSRLGNLRPENMASKLKRTPLWVYLFCMTALLLLCYSVFFSRVSAAVDD